MKDTGSSTQWSLHTCASSWQQSIALYTIHGIAACVTVILCISHGYCRVSLGTAEYRWVLQSIAGYNVVIVEHRAGLTGASHGHHAGLTGASHGHHAGLMGASHGHHAGLMGASQGHHAGLMGASHGQHAGIAGQHAGIDEASRWRHGSITRS